MTFIFWRATMKATTRNNSSPPIFGTPFPARRGISFGRLFEKFPLVATAENGILALHGGLPDLPGLEDVNESPGEMIRGAELPGGLRGTARGASGRMGWRLQLGEQYFSRLMQRYRKRF